MNRLAALYGRSPRAISSHPQVRLQMQAAIATWGVDQNRNTGSSYNRQTGILYLFVPFVLQQVVIDIRIAGTYAVGFVDSGAASPATLYTLSAALSAGAASENTITLAAPIVLLPGTYYLSAYNDATVGWSDKSASPNVVNTSLVLSSVYYDGSIYAYSTPSKIVGYPINILGLSSWVPPVAL